MVTAMAVRPVSRTIVERASYTTEDSATACGADLGITLGARGINTTIQIQQQRIYMVKDRPGFQRDVQVERTYRTLVQLLASYSRGLRG